MIIKNALSLFVKVEKIKKEQYVSALVIEVLSQQ